jgi:hypothetical protein
MVRIGIRHETEKQPSLTLDVDSAITIDELKVLVAQAIGASPDGLRLLFCTEWLDDIETVASSNITDGSVIIAYFPSVGNVPSQPSIRDLDDPTLPRWIRFPSELWPETTLRAQAAQLQEMGLSLRQSLNGVRLGAGSLEHAANYIEYLQTEEDNLMVEHCLLHGSPLSRSEQISRLNSWATAQDRKKRSRAVARETIPTPDDLQPLLAAPEREIAAMARGRFGGAAETVALIVGAIREAEVEKPATFWNPFAVLAFAEPMTDMIFGDRLSFIACLAPDACLFLIERWKGGTNFVDLCDALDGAEGCVETAVQLLE